MISIKMTESLARAILSASDRQAEIEYLHDEISAQELARRYEANADQFERDLDDAWNEREAA